MCRIWYPETVLLMGEQGVLEQRGRSTASGFSVAFTSTAAAGRTDMGALDTPLTSISIFKDMTWLGLDRYERESERERRTDKQAEKVDRKRER